MTPVVLAGDLGGSSFRAALFAPDGARLALARRPVEAGDEVDAEAWPATLEALVGELLAAVPDARVASLALTAFARSEVLVDGAGRPLRPAFTFRHARASAEATALGVTPFHALARLAFVRAREPAVFAATARVLPAKDFLNLRLTGEAASDAPSHAPLAPAGVYDEAAFAAAAIPPSLFAKLRRPRAALGRVREGLPGAFARIAGAAVAVSSLDTWCATLGLGAHRAGFAYNLSGTSEVNGVMLAAPARAEGLISLAWDDEAEAGPVFHLGGPSQAGADCLAWLAGLTGADVATLAREAGDVALDDEPLVFLPYLTGERVPFWDATLRGGFAGLARSHRRGHLARAVMEGVAFHDRVVFERAADGAGARPAAVLVGGGGAASDLWCRIKADSWGLELRRPALDEPGLAGAFRLARGLLDAGPAPAAPAVAIFRPDPARAAALDRRFARFRAALSAPPDPASRAGEMV